MPNPRAPIHPSNHLQVQTTPSRKEFQASRTGAVEVSAPVAAPPVPCCGAEAGHREKLFVPVLASGAAGVTSHRSIWQTGAAVLRAAWGCIFSAIGAAPAMESTPRLGRSTARRGCGPGSGPEQAMSKRIFGIAIAASLALAASFPAWADFAGTVVGVTDGDTITVLDASKARHKVRLAGIDAPERGQPGGFRSKESLSRLVYERSVRVEETRNCDGRIVGKVWVAPQRDAQLSGPRSTPALPSIPWVQRGGSARYANEQSSGGSGERRACRTGQDQEGGAVGEILNRCRRGNGEVHSRSGRYGTLAYLTNRAGGSPEPVCSRADPASRQLRRTLQTRHLRPSVLAGGIGHANVSARRRHEIIRRHPGPRRWRSAAVKVHPAMCISATTAKPFGRMQASRVRQRASGCGR